MNKVFLSSKITVACLVLLMLFFAYSKFGQIKNQRAIEKEKQKLIAQANTLTKKNQELTQSISYLSSPDFKEKVAREQLDLKRNGETAYSFAEVKPAEILAPPPAPPLSNPQKWWKYFNGNY